MVQKRTMNGSANGGDSPKSSDDENSRTSEFVLEVPREAAVAGV